MELKYRSRMYERYATNVQGEAGGFDLQRVIRWGKSYDRYLRNWLPKNKDAAIADVACGSGFLLAYLLEKGYENLAGVDISPEQVELAKRIHPNIVEGDICQFLKSHPESFDLVTAFDIIEHLRKEEALEFLDACYQALRPGGRVIIQTPNADSPWGVMIRYGDFTHEISFSPNSLKGAMRVCNFTDLEAREMGPVPHGIISLIRWVLWKGLRTFFMGLTMIETSNKGSGVLTPVFITSGIRPNPTAQPSDNTR
jgi:SAM-dependent methyltransferase